MASLTSRAQDIFLRLQEPEQALAMTGYAGRMRQIIDDPNGSVAEKVLRVLSSELFRSVSFAAENQAYLQARIQHAVAKKEALTFVLPFGGYKTHYSYSYPLPNLAEVFNILYMKVFAHVLNNVYPYGVRVVYVPDLRDHVSEITAIPLASLDTYHHAYEELFHHFVRPSEALSLVGNEALCTELGVSSEAIKRKVLERLAAQTESAPDDMVVALLGSTHISGVDSPSTSALIEHVGKTYLYHKFYVGCIDDELLRAFPNAILITSKKKVPYYLTSIKGFYNSVVQFWVGDGILLRQGEKLFPTIASKSQIKSFHFVDFASIPSTELPGRNNYLKHIPIYEKIDY